MNYMNEFDPVTARWLGELRDAGLIPPCEIDTRSIEDVTPNDLRGYTQCHFFAGIGGWPLALQLAGWPADRPIWTGSCPCQPFSAAGKGDGFADERHLWPSFHWLIGQSLPAVVVGEQVASAAVGPWIDLVLTDLEALGYACGAYAGPAAGVGAPHLRDRSYWVGYARSQGLQERQCDAGVSRREAQPDAWQTAERASVHPVRLADADGRQQPRITDGQGCQSDRPPPGRHEGDRVSTASGEFRSERTGPTNGHWRDADWLGCRDGKWRPVEPGTFPLAHGVSVRVGRLRGYGNAIVPQQAAEFIRSLM